MARKRRTGEVFSMSFLDCMSCGFGAVVLLFLILDHAAQVEAVDLGDPGVTAEIDLLEELVGVSFPAVSVAAATGEGIGPIGDILMSGLEIVRVYTKIPGHDPDMERPFTVTRGATVADVARLVHRDIAESLKFARVWGQNVFDGQQVGPDHPVEDGDVVELHR